MARLRKHYRFTKKFVSSLLRGAELTGESDGITQAGKFVERAIALAPNEARGYTARRRIRHVWLWDWAGGQEDLEKAVTLEPRDSHAQDAYALMLCTLGRSADCTATLQRVTELDPLWFAGWENLVFQYAVIGDFAAAEAISARAGELEPQSRYLSDLAVLRLLQGRTEEALEIFRKPDLNADDHLQGVALAEHALGHQKESQKALDHSSG